jgi:hypothetical protein
MTLEATILALERAALDRWGKGDPEGHGEWRILHTNWSFAKKSKQ